MPFSGMLALIYLMLNIQTVELSRTSISLLIFSILALLWWFFLERSGLLFKVLAIPYAFVMYLFIYNTISDSIIRQVKHYAHIYIATALLQYFFPSVYLSIFEKLVRAVKVKEVSGLRGVSALATEPSFTAMVVFTFMLILIYSKTFRKSGIPIFTNLAISLTIILTKAATGFGMFALFILLEGFRKFNLKRAVVLGAFVFVLIFTVAQFDESQFRGLNILMLLASEPQNMLYESSLFLRVYSLAFGFVSLYSNPMGEIFGSVSLEYVKRMTDSIFYGHTMPEYFDLVGASALLPSTLGSNLVNYGLFYMAFYLVVFLPIFLKKRVPIIIKVLIFAYTAQSFSFAFSLLWLLVVLVEKGYFQSERGRGNSVMASNTSHTAPRKNEG